MTDETANRNSTRQRLLIATLETIDEYGIEKATTRRISERASANLQLIQYYFGGKSAMIDEAQQYVVDVYIDELQQAIQGSNGLVEGVRRGMAFTWQLAQERPSLVQPDLLLQYVRSTGEEVAGESDEGEDAEPRRETQARVAEMLTALAERTGDKIRVPIEQFTLLMAAGIGGLVLEYRLTGDAVHVGAAVDTFTEFLVSLIEPADQV